MQALHSVKIDFNMCIAFPITVISDMPDFIKELKDMPETILSCMGLALHQV